jgi:uncharacterized protein
MRRRKALAVLGAAAVPATGLGQGSARTQRGQRVIFQVSDGDKARWNLALSNVRNVLADLGKGNVEIELVAYGPGVAMLKAESAVADWLANALDSNVTLIACENTMQTEKLSRDDMYGGVSFVQTGVSHIMQRQREGWAYVRP